MLAVIGNPLASSAAYCFMKANKARSQFCVPHSSSVLVSSKYDPNHQQNKSPEFQTDFSRSSPQSLSAFAGVFLQNVTATLIQSSRNRKTADDANQGKPFFQLYACGS